MSYVDDERLVKEALDRPLTLRMALAIHTGKQRELLPFEVSLLAKMLRATPTPEA